MTGLSNFELEDMFEDGHLCMEACNHVFLQENLQMQSDEPNIFEVEEKRRQEHRVTILALIAGSDSFRQCLLKLKTDPIYCSLMQSSLATFLSSSKIRFLSQGGKEVEISRIGAAIYISRECKSRAWYVLISGQLCVSLDDLLQNEAESVRYELHPGEIFGGYGIQESSKDAEPTHIKIWTMQASKYIELSGKRLSEFMQQDSESGRRLLSLMSGR